MSLLSCILDFPASETCDILGWETVSIDIADVRQKVLIKPVGICVNHDFPEISSFHGGKGYKSQRRRLISISSDVAAAVTSASLLNLVSGGRVRMAAASEKGK